MWWVTANLDYSGSVSKARGKVPKNLIYTFISSFTMFFYYSRSLTLDFIHLPLAFQTKRSHHRNLQWKGLSGEEKAFRWKGFTNQINMSSQWWCDLISACSSQCRPNTRHNGNALIIPQKQQNSLSKRFHLYRLKRPNILSHTVFVVSVYKHHQTMPSGKKLNRETPTINMQPVWRLMGTCCCAGCAMLLAVTFY